MRGEAPPGPGHGAVRDTRVRASGGFVPVRVLMPVERPRGVIVYYHGGGWVIGGLDDFDRLGRLLAQRTGCTVVLVDYRLAPEYRFPTAVDDSWAALRWADEHRAELAAPAGERARAADRRRRQRGRQPVRGHGDAGQGRRAARGSRCRCSSTR